MSDTEEKVATGWCKLAERRLFKKIITHKPVGVSRHFHMICLYNLMNNVYEDEDTDFEDVLDEEDLDRLKVLSAANDNHTPVTFKPRYKIRPTLQQIREKLDELYDMNALEENEYLPPEFTTQSDFFLPDGEFSELIRKKEEEVNSKEQSFLAPTPTINRSLPRRKRRDSGETHSSRSSTPASSRDLRKS